jgi:hypothetical protein
LLVQPTYLAFRDSKCVPDLAPAQAIATQLGDLDAPRRGGGRVDMPRDTAFGFALILGSLSLPIPLDVRAAEHAQLELSHLVRGDAKARDSRGGSPPVARIDSTSRGGSLRAGRSPCRPVEDRTEALPQL